MAKWYESGLSVGDEIVGNITETGRSADMVRYIQDIPCGIIVEIFCGNHRYKRCLNWSAIHSGALTVHTAYGQLRAKRIVQKGEWDDGED